MAVWVWPYMNQKIVCPFLVLLVCQSVLAEEPDAESPVWHGLKSSFSFPAHEFLVAPYDNEWRNAIQGVGVSLAYNHPLMKTETAQGVAGQGETATNDTVQLGLKYTPLSYWFVDAAFIKYLQPDLQKSWNPDWSYRFGYDDWHPYTLSLVYNNTGGNHLTAKKPSFSEGTWSLGWKFPLPEALNHLLVSGYGDAMACSSALGYTRSYIDSTTNLPASNKTVASLGCKYSIAGWWYVNFSLYYYPDKEQKQPWNPDYTYGFGYFDWHPGKISLQYNNYSGNRFKSSERAAGTGQFKNGSISLSWSKSW